MKPNEKFPHLLSPLKIGKLTFKHRMMSSPTSLAEVGQDGSLTPENIDYYQLRAMGDASLVTIGDCVVDFDTGRGHPLQIGINEPAAL